MDALERSQRDQAEYEQNGAHDAERQPPLCGTRRQRRENEMLFLWQYGVWLHDRSASSEPAADARYAALDAPAAWPRAQYSAGILSEGYVRAASARRLATATSTAASNASPSNGLLNTRKFPAPPAGTRSSISERPVIKMTGSLGCASP